MLLNGAACWVRLDASRPCSCHFGPCAVSTGLSSNQVNFKNLKNPKVPPKDLSSRVHYTAKMQNSSHESWAILLGSLMHVAQQIFAVISCKEFTSTQLNSIWVKFRARLIREGEKKK